MSLPKPPHPLLSRPSIEKTLYGWFSQRACDLYGYTVYLDDYGREVILTEVTETMTPNSKWEDLKYEGIVVEIARSFVLLEAC